MIELLAPAKNADIGITAVKSGADAVYIGASRFGARKEAGNPVSEIARLTKFAHLYRAKVYLALNTILYDHEFDQALSLIREAWNAGIDGLIIQDMGLLECSLPPVPLIASTQTDNRSPEKVKFLQDCGFSRVILARELNLNEIKTIRAASDVELEFFVHGALCVSYSGQCYISEAIAGRSANRGECAQICRNRFTLSDKDGQLLKQDQYLLSLRDLNLSGMLKELLDAGISSFKIEGRLKDEYYVKNITAFYRKQLDDILESDNRWKRASSGISAYSFLPDPEKTFNRGYTDYFAKGTPGTMSTLWTSKSLGKSLGQVKDTGTDWFTLDRNVDLNNGDGLCFFDDQYRLTGFLVNSFRNGRIFPSEMKSIAKGLQVYRNQDAGFERELAAETSRKIRCRVHVTESAEGFIVSIKDEDGLEVSKSFSCAREPAKNAERAASMMKEQLSKMGNSPFSPVSVTLDLEGAWFIPVSEINRWRRELTAGLESLRAESYRRTLSRIEPNSVSFPSKLLDYRGNVLNQKAVSFYRRHGVEEIRQAFEESHDKNAALMTMRFCIKREHGLCPREDRLVNENVKGPFYLSSGNKRFRLVFDCSACEMRVHLDKAETTINPEND
ncbi:MAG: U32 family peptidase [Bacteroidales bacterium]